MEKNEIGKRADLILGIGNVALNRWVFCVRKGENNIIYIRFSNVIGCNIKCNVILRIYLEFVGIFMNIYLKQQYVDYCRTYIAAMWSKII